MNCNYKNLQNMYNSFCLKKNNNNNNNFEWLFHSLHSRTRNASKLPLVAFGSQRKNNKENKV